MSGKKLVVGNSPECDFRADLPGTLGALFTITRSGDSCSLRPDAAADSLIVDGETVYSYWLEDASEHTLVCNGHPFALKFEGEAARAWLGRFDVGNWWVQTRNGADRWEGPLKPGDVALFAGGAPGEFLTLCTGLSGMAFHLEQVVPTLRKLPVANGSPVLAETEPDPPEASEINVDYGEFTCPVCWLKFDRGDAMNIAVHASLRGDAVLGEEHMERFLASRFNDRGQALDAMGLAAPEIACPHCRRKLPPGFVELPHHIFSIVGAPTSGKSYFLSVLTKVLQTCLFRDFGVSFRDAAPVDNAVINDMKRHLFSASTPEEAYLAKTDLEGALYETLPRQGRDVKLPKPFVFRLSPDRGGEGGSSMVFYDNAGEHFEPGQNSADSPGAQHIAVASGVIFLFDPLFNNEFRKLLEGHSDPQLKARQPDQQDVILSECEVRMKEILGLSSAERAESPLAVVVGKSDAWIDRLGDEPLLPAVEATDGRARVSLANLGKNSARVRALLMEVCPAIVANAETISSEVLYFAVSALGHSPVSFEDSEGVKRIGPDPRQLAPARVEDPLLWMLAKTTPDLVPSRP